MKHNKLTYESPVIVSLHVCVEGVLCGSPFVSGGSNESISDDSNNTFSNWDWSI